MREEEQVIVELIILLGRVLLETFHFFFKNGPMLYKFIFIQVWMSLDSILKVL
jgi:hypothetical protein